MKKIVITIDKKGKVSIDYRGFVANQCDLAEKNLFEKLDKLLVTRKKERRKTTTEMQAEIEKEKTVKIKE